MKGNYAETREHVEYEIGMFRWAINNLRQFAPSPLHDVVLESFAVHARNLINYFYGGSGNDDILANDFIPDWETIRPPITPVLSEAKSKANKQLSHLSYSRLNKYSGSNKSWDISGIARDLGILIDLFEANLTC